MGDNDFDVLWEDFDTVVALESMGVGLENPMMQTIAKRWCVLEEIEREIVAHESAEMMERAQAVADGAADGSVLKKVGKDAVKFAGKTAKNAAGVVGKHGLQAAKVAGKGVGKLSAALGVKFKEWAVHYIGEAKEKLDELRNKSERMTEHLQKIEAKLKTNATFTTEPIKTAAWVSRVCYSGKVDFDRCVKFPESVKGIDKELKAYTIKVRQFEGLLVGRYKDTEGVLEKLDYSMNSAVHRASGVVGQNTQRDVQARFLPGNVAIVTRGNPPKEKVDFGVGRETHLGATIEPLNKEKCQAALKAVEKITKSLSERSARTGVFSYTGIYDELDAMKDDLSGLEGKDLRIATLRYKNAVAFEDAITTALARVGDGLLNWVTASIKA